MNQRKKLFFSVVFVVFELLWSVMRQWSYLAQDKMPIETPESKFPRYNNKEGSKLKQQQKLQRLSQLLKKQTNKPLWCL
jgi:hypothetical protein